MPTDIECNHRRAFFPRSEDFVSCAQCATELVVHHIAAERQRQISAEGWTPEHDDEHDNGEMALAAACYAAEPHRMFVAEELAGRGYEPFTAYKDAWPWHDKWWKPGKRRRNLVKAAALLVAEIERLDRAEAADAAESLRIAQAS